MFILDSDFRHHSFKYRFIDSKQTEKKTRRNEIIPTAVRVGIQEMGRQRKKKQKTLMIWEKNPERKN